MTGGTRLSAVAGGGRSRAALGRKRSGLQSARGQRRPDSGAEGAQPDLQAGLRRGTGKGKERFSIFLKKEHKQKFKHKFEFNTQK
jgi:hypothetical protein